MGDGRAIEYVLKYVWCLKTKTSADPWALMSVKPQTWFSKPNLYWRQPDSVAIFNLRNRASIMSAIWNNLFQSLIWVLDWWLSVVCCGGLWLLSLLWTVLAVDLDWLLWTICEPTPASAANVVVLSFWNVCMCVCRSVCSVCITQKNCLMFNSLPLKLIKYRQIL